MPAIEFAECGNIYFIRALQEEWKGGRGEWEIKMSIEKKTKHNRPPHSTARHGTEHLK